MKKLSILCETGGDNFPNSINFGVIDKINYINMKYHVSDQAERQAVNTVIQGSAADVVKVAMVNIEHELQEIFCKTKNKPMLVLHLHDELIYEVPSKYLNKVGKVIKKNMENSLQLSVPLPVKLKIGSSWGDMREYNL